MILQFFDSIQRPLFAVGLFLLVGANSYASERVRLSSLVCEDLLASRRSATGTLIPMEKWSSLVQDIPVPADLRNEMAMAQVILDFSEPLKFEIAGEVHKRLSAIEGLKIKEVHRHDPADSGYGSFSYFLLLSGPTVRLTFALEEIKAIFEEFLPHIRVLLDPIWIPALARQPKDRALPNQPLEMLSEDSVYDLLSRFSDLKADGITSAPFQYHRFGEVVVGYLVDAYSMALLLEKEKNNGITSASLRVFNLPDRRAASKPSQNFDDLLRAMQAVMGGRQRLGIIDEENGFEQSFVVGLEDYAQIQRMKYETAKAQGSTGNLNQTLFESLLNPKPPLPEILPPAELEPLIFSEPENLADFFYSDESSREEFLAKFNSIRQAGAMHDIFFYLMSRLSEVQQAYVNAQFDWQTMSRHMGPYLAYKSLASPRAARSLLTLLTAIDNAIASEDLPKIGNMEKKNRVNLLFARMNLPEGRIKVPQLEKIGIHLSRIKRKTPEQLELNGSNSLPVIEKPDTTTYSDAVEFFLNSPKSSRREFMKKFSGLRYPGSMHRAFEFLKTRLTEAQQIRVDEMFDASTMSRHTGAYLSATTQAPSRRAARDVLKFLTALDVVMETNELPKIGDMEKINQVNLLFERLNLPPGRTHVAGPDDQVLNSEQEAELERIINAVNDAYLNHLKALDENKGKVADPSAGTSLEKMDQIVVSYKRSIKDETDPQQLDLEKKKTFEALVPLFKQFENDRAD